MLIEWVRKHILKYQTSRHEKKRLAKEKLWQDILLEARIHAITVKHEKPLELCLHYDCIEKVLKRRRIEPLVFGTRQSLLTCGTDVVEEELRRRYPEMLFHRELMRTDGFWLPVERKATPRPGIRPMSSHS